MTYEELQAAVQILGLAGPVTVSEIKKRYRHLVKQLHPDVSDCQSTDAVSRLNAAYQLLLAYGEGFRFNFTLEEFLAQNPEERLRRQFADDPVWGGR